MNPQDNNIQKIKELLGRYKSGIIAMQANPSVDGVAAATALYLALSKMGKHVSIVSSSSPQMDLAGIDKVQNTLASGGNHLVISFPYTEGAIDKVDYSIAADSFNLIIIPNSDTSRIDPNQVKFSYTGGKVEFIITVDVPNLNSLGTIYTENQSEFQGKNIINIDRHLINNNFGTINFVQKASSSTSELVLAILRDMNAELDKDIATNIYAGIIAATNNFTSYSVNPNTFEAAAFLMKHGAVKKLIPQPGATNAQGQNVPQPGMPSMQNAPQQRPMGNGFQPNFGFGQQMNAPMPQMQQPMQPRMPQQNTQQAPLPPLRPQYAPQQPAQPMQPVQQYPMQQDMRQPRDMNESQNNQQNQKSPFSFLNPMGNQNADQFRAEPQPENNQVQQPRMPQQTQKVPPAPMQQAPVQQAPVQNQRPAPQPPQVQNIPEEPQPITDDQPEQEEHKSPQDWLKPKLFRGGNM